MLMERKIIGAAVAMTEEIRSKKKSPESRFGVSRRGELPARHIQTWVDRNWHCIGSVVEDYVHSAMVTYLQVIIHAVMM